MTDPNPIEHEFDPVMDTPITRVRIAVPWWTRVSAAVLGVAIALSLLIGTYSSFRGVENERRNAAFARTIATRDKLETDCFRERNGDLTRVASKLVGLTAELFVRLAQRDPTVQDGNDEIYARFKELSNQRDIDDGRLDRAVEECSQHG